MLINALVLFLGALVGVLLGCNLAGYDISNARKFGAPLVFAVLAALPITLPVFLDLIIPLVAFYMLLMDDSLERSKVNRVFGTSMIFVIGAILFVYSSGFSQGV
ncbi:MAG: hypothetical protein AAGG55_11150 [Pseudomonadota bacterium]